MKKVLYVLTIVLVASTTFVSCTEEQIEPTPQSTIISGGTAEDDKR
ncbi:hypothetical protein [Pseudochryseolinea flava]|nr:hypothetical protein [Pseudochryseolinea flava]